MKELIERFAMKKRDMNTSDFDVKVSESEVELEWFEQTISEIIINLPY